MQMAERGMGIALLARPLVLEALRAGRLVELLPHELKPMAYVQALSPDAHLSRRARALIDYMRHAMRRDPLFCATP